MSVSFNLGFFRVKKQLILSLISLILVGLSSACDEDTQTDDPCAQDICGEGTRCLNGLCVPLRQTPPLDPELDMQAGRERPDLDMSVDMLTVDADLLDADLLDTGLIDAESPDMESLDMITVIEADMTPCEASEEVCDLEDNDCDGIIDEGDPLIGQTCETALVGPCLEGIYACRGGRLTCDGLQQPDYEVCDALDNDCDGLTDEGVYPIDLPPNADLSCLTGALGLCRDGETRCIAGAWVCAPFNEVSEELCDGLDNDCDGVADEESSDAYQICDLEEGEGLCRSGLSYCVNSDLICRSIYEPQPEYCDLEDNDCDGSIDEDVPEQGQACFLEQQGLCRIGALNCIAGTLNCEEVYAAQPETCDGQDQDCDGAIDEDFTDKGDYCEIGVGACLRAGRWTCTVDGQDLFCQGQTGEAITEVCDGIDNDCDGLIDNLSEPPQEIEHCGACGTVCPEVERGYIGCAQSECVIAGCERGWFDRDGLFENGCEVSCQPTADPTEICDGLDNNCDGQIDELNVCAEVESGFCTARERALPFLDIFCDEFNTSQFFEEYWVGSPTHLLTEQSEPDGSLIYRHINVSETGGGHTRRIRNSAQGLAIGLSVLPRGGFTIGLGYSSYAHPLALDLPEEERATPSAWQGGYALDFIPNLNGAGMEVVLRTTPNSIEQDPITFEQDSVVLATGLSPQLHIGAEHEQLHWVRWQLDQVNGFSLTVDGQEILLSFDESQSERLPNEQSRFDRASLWLGPSLGLQIEPNTEIHAWAVELDPDQDGYYGEQDNCPEVFNPLQEKHPDYPWGIACYDYDADGLTNDVDPCPLNAHLTWGDEDNNGRDDACDWPDLIVISSQNGYNQPWLWRMNPEMPLVSQLAETFAGTNRFAISAQAEIFFEFAEQYIYLHRDNGEHILVNSNARLIGALGEGIVIQELATGNYSFSSDRFDRPPTTIVNAQDTELTAYTSADRQWMTLLRKTEQSYAVSLYNAQGEEVQSPLEIPVALSTVPYVAWLPEQAQYLVVAQDPNLFGSHFLDPTLTTLQAYRDQVFKRILLTPERGGFLALEESLSGLLALNYYADYESTTEAQVIYDGTEMGFERAFLQRSPETLVTQADHDGDLITDDSDLCVNYPKQHDHWIEQPSDFVNTAVGQVKYAGDGFAHYTRTKFNLLSPQGEILFSHDLPYTFVRKGIGPSMYMQRGALKLFKPIPFENGQLIGYYSIEPDGTISEPTPLMLEGIIGSIYNYGLRKYNGGYQFFFRADYQGNWCYCSIFIPQNLSIIPQEPTADMYMDNYSIRPIEVEQQEFAFAGNQIKVDDEWQDLHDAIGRGTTAPTPVYNHDRLFVTFTRGGKVFNTQVTPYTYEYTDLERYPSQPSSAKESSVIWSEQGAFLDWKDLSALDQGEVWIRKLVHVDSGLQKQSLRLDLAHDPIQESGHLNTSIDYSRQHKQAQVYKSIRNKVYFRSSQGRCE